MAKKFNLAMFGADCSYSKKEVFGAMVEMPFVKAFVHKKDSGTWCVSEYSTGATIFEGWLKHHTNKSKVITEAREKLQAAGEEKVLALIATKLEAIGKPFNE
jgi:hypothetical protein